MDFKEMEEVKEIKENSSVKQKLIYEIQDLEKANGFETIDSDKAIVNLALINLLYDLKTDSSDLFINAIFSSLKSFYEDVFPTIESEKEFIKSEIFKLERVKKEAELKLKIAEGDLEESEKELAKLSEEDLVELESN